MFVLDSSSDSKASSLISETDQEDSSEKSKKYSKRSKTVISRSSSIVETPTMKSGMKYADWVHWVQVWQHFAKLPKKDQQGYIFYK